MISMNLGYLVRSGAPDAVDCIVPTAYGNLAVDLILRGETGRMVALRDGSYGSVPIDEVVVDQEGRRRGALLRHRALPAAVRRRSRAAADGARRRRLSGRWRRRPAGGGRRDAQTRAARAGRHGRRAAGGARRAHAARGRRTRRPWTALARGGVVGLVRTVPEGMPPGSDVANLAVLGLRPGGRLQRAQPARGRQHRRRARPRTTSPTAATSSPSPTAS